MKIYTKTGDKGGTSLLGGRRVSKDDIRIEAYGTVDELNSSIGLLLSKLNEVEIITELHSIQNLLFTIGSNLANDPESPLKIDQIEETHIAALEERMDEWTAKLPPLKNFILPGGSEKNALTHVCRTLCRRAERRAVTLSKAENIDPLLIKYINRLSDYFFVLARYFSLVDRTDEIKWKS